jgi:hypothetical protein
MSAKSSDSIPIQFWLGIGICVGLVTLGCQARPAEEGPAEPETPRSVDAPAFTLSGPVDPDVCRQPSEPGLDPANRYCRQMKQVQAWMNPLLDQRTLFDGVDTGARLRRTEFFGIHHDIPIVDPPYSAEAEFPSGDAMTRAAAILLASDCPIDERDHDLATPLAHSTPWLPAVCGEEIDEHAEIPVTEWFWQLPDYYADLTNIQERSKAMREDVADWLIMEGVPNFVNAPGARGEADLHMLKLLKLTYMVRSNPQRFHFDVGDDAYGGKVTEILESLILQGFDLGNYDPPSGHDDDDWQFTDVPMSGQDFDEYFDEENTNVHRSPETENHLLSELTYHYLINQLITLDQVFLTHGGPYLDPEEYMGTLMEDPYAWFEYAETPLEDALLEVLSRVLYNGMFETNAKPYQRISTDAILMLATYSAEDRVRKAATNALHFMATMHAFQSLDGRAYMPRRRSCDQAYHQTLISGNERIFAMLSGTFKWNDSPYGFRGVADEVADDIAEMTDEIETCLGELEEPVEFEDEDACYDNADWPTTACESDPDCHWKHYTWKLPKLQPDIRARYSESTNIPGDPGAYDLGAYVPRMTADSEAEFWAAFSNYEPPEAIRSFAFDKRQGYWARAMASYKKGHYSPMLAAIGDNPPQYFDAVGVPYTSNQRTQQAPELWFATPDYVNVSGGMYNSFYGDNEQNKYYAPIHTFSSWFTCSKEEQWEDYVEDWGRSGDFYQILGKPHMWLQDFDAFARPTALLFGVQTDEVSGVDVYRPFGTARFPYELAKEYMPMLAGNARAPWRSTNVGTYKNFSYGYLQDCNESDIAGCANLYAEWPVTLPSEWGLVPYTFALDGNNDTPVRFAVYDLSSVMAAQNLEPVWLVTGKVWKKRWDIHAFGNLAHGFWEVVPYDWYEDAEEIETVINLSHDAGDFPEGDGLFEDVDNPYRYQLLSTGESVYLTPRLGGQWPATWVNYSTHVQGISEITDTFTNPLDLETYYIELGNSAIMNDLPLLDVKAVDDRYNYVTATIDMEEVPRYYACAKDGWMCVNAFDPEVPTATPHYLWVDARPDPNDPNVWAPYWESGTYSPNEIWPCGCGEGGSWVPGPPDTAEPNGGGDGDGDGDGDGGEDDAADAATVDAGEEEGGEAGTTGTGTTGTTSTTSTTSGDDEGDDGDDILEPCISSESEVAECVYGEADPDCPHPDHICGYVGENKDEEIATCVCLDDPDACFPPNFDYVCQSDEDCEFFGDSICFDDECICAPDPG